MTSSSSRDVSKKGKRVASSNTSSDTGSVHAGPSKKASKARKELAGKKGRNGAKRHRSESASSRLGSKGKVNTPAKSNSSGRKRSSSSESRGRKPKDKAKKNQARKTAKKPTGKDARSKRKEKNKTKKKEAEVSNTGRRSCSASKTGGHGEDDGAASSAVSASAALSGRLAVPGTRDKDVAGVVDEADADTGDEPCSSGGLSLPRYPQAVAWELASPVLGQGCCHELIRKSVHGTFVPVGDNHGRVVYAKRKDEHPPGGLDVVLYYWDDRDGMETCGWWIGPSVGSEMVWAYNVRRDVDLPPVRDWNIPPDGPVDPSFSVITLRVGESSSNAPSAGIRSKIPVTIALSASTTSASEVASHAQQEQQRQQAQQQQEHKQQLQEEAVLSGAVFSKKSKDSKTKKSQQKEAPLEERGSSGTAKKKKQEERRKEEKASKRDPPKDLPEEPRHIPMKQSKMLWLDDLPSRKKARRSPSEPRRPPSVPQSVEKPEEVVKSAEVKAAWASHHPPVLKPHPGLPERSVEDNALVASLGKTSVERKAANGVEQALPVSQKPECTEDVRRRKEEEMKRKEAELQRRREERRKAELAKLAEEEEARRDERAARRREEQKKREEDDARRKASEEKRLAEQAARFQAREEAQRKKAEEERQRLSRSGAPVPAAPLMPAAPIGLLPSAVLPASASAGAAMPVTVPVVPVLLAPAGTMVPMSVLAPGAVQPTPPPPPPSMLTTAAPVPIPVLPSPPPPSAA